MPTWSPEEKTPTGRRAAPGPARRVLPTLATIATLVAGVLPAIASDPQLDILGFTLRITSDDGEVTHVLHGERMQQFDATGVQHTEQPRLEVMAEGRLDWVWTAPAAVHYPTEKRLVLIGITEGVQFPGPRNPRTDIETSDVTILTGSREVMTDARSTLLRPGLFMTGVGMYADVAAEVIELRSEVNTVYSPDEVQEISE